MKLIQGQHMTWIKGSGGLTNHVSAIQHKNSFEAPKFLILKILNNDFIYLRIYSLNNVVELEWSAHLFVISTLHVIDKKVCSAYMYVSMQAILVHV